MKKDLLCGLSKGAKGTDPKEVVIGVGAAFQKEIKKTICGIPLDDVLKNVKAGIEEEGMVPRVVKILDTSDVCFMALEAAKLSGSGIGIGIQSKGTTVIHQKDLYPLSNLELFPPGASDGSGDLPKDRKECRQICKRGTGCSDPLHQRSNVPSEIPGQGGPDAHSRDGTAGPGSRNNRMGGKIDAVPIRRTRKRKDYIQDR